MSDERGGRYVAGGDLGGTRFRVVVADEDGKFVSRANCLTEAHRGKDAVLSSMIGTLRDAISLAPSAPSAIAISAPGPMDPWRGVIHEAPNLPGWVDVPVKDILEQEFGVPVQLGHDANVAALAEQRYGAGRGTRSMIYVTVSTGIGGGIVVDGKMVLGSGGGAGEIGHMSLEFNGPLCNCGNRGCLEVLASGPAIRRQAVERLNAGEPSSLISITNGHFEQVTPELIGDAARGGDALAISVLDRAGRYLGSGLVSLMHSLDPELIVLGGGVTNAGDLILSPMRDEIKDRAMGVYLDRTRIVLAELGGDVGLYGTVAMALDGLNG